MKLADVMRPAIRLAEQGFPVSEKLVREFAEEGAELQQFPVSRHIFLNDGKPYRTGDIFRQPLLAATLKRIAKKGPRRVLQG